MTGEGGTDCAGDEAPPAVQSTSVKIDGVGAKKYSDSSYTLIEHVKEMNKKAPGA